MAITDDDIDDIFNLAVTQVDQWLSEELQRFMAGTIDRAADTLWRSQPADVQDKIRQEQPAAANILEGLRKRGK